MGTSKWGDDTYRAIGVTMLLFGILLLTDRIITFSKLGFGWILDIDNLILYAAIIFLLLKKDKTIGIVLSIIWIIMNFSLIMHLLGTMSGYIIPSALIIIGGIILYKVK